MIRLVPPLMGLVLFMSLACCLLPVSSAANRTASTRRTDMRKGEVLMTYLLALQLLKSILVLSDARSFRRLTNRLHEICALEIDLLSRNHVPRQGISRTTGWGIKISHILKRYKK